MTSILMNYLSVIVSLVTLFGISIHDTRMDRAFMHAMTEPAVSVDRDFFSEKLSGEHHIHVEGEAFNLRTQQPAVQPKSQDDKKYATAKRQKYSSFGSEYIWPSI